MPNLGTALITGSSSGIGRAAAEALARNGYRILLGYSTGHDRVTDTASAIQARYGVGAIPVRMDLRDTTAAVDICLAAARDAGDLTCLVNNAGVNERSPATNLDLVRMNEVLAINTITPIILASHVGRLLAESGRGGSIVNVTSIHETVTISGGTIYCASKGALGMATKVLALEFAAHRVRVNSVAPGETATAMNGLDEDTYAAVRRPAIPMKRPGGVHEIAAAIGFLTSPAASYITGTCLVADGGLVLTGADENVRSAQTSGATLMEGTQ